MLSEEQRSAPLTLADHLDQARRQAIGRGMVWFWLLNWLVVLFLAIRYEVYSQAGLASDHMLPWSFQSELALVMVALLLLPVISLFCDHLQDRIWLRIAALVMVLWGGSGPCIFTPLARSSCVAASVMPMGSCGSTCWRHSSRFIPIARCFTAISWGR